MPNQSDRAYGLTTLCPIKNGAPVNSKGSHENESFVAITKDRLRALSRKPNEESPMAEVPNTYLCRFFILNDVYYEGKPANLEHLKSKYLVFTSNFHGELEPYLRRMWDSAVKEKDEQNDIRSVWEHCVGFDDVKNADDFVAYIGKCQVYTTFFFNGSTDESLDEQLKGLYLKQELTKFVFEQQGEDSAKLQQAFKEFVARVQPKNLHNPTWKPGASCLDSVVTGDT